MESRRRGPSPLSRGSTPLSPPPQPESSGGRARRSLLPPPGRAARSGPGCRAPSPTVPSGRAPGRGPRGLGLGAGRRAGAGAERGGRGAPAAAAISAPRSRCPFMEMKDPA